MFIVGNIPEDILLSEIHQANFLNFTGFDLFGEVNFWTDLRDGSRAFGQPKSGCLLGNIPSGRPETEN